MVTPSSSEDVPYPPAERKLVINKNLGLFFPPFLCVYSLKYSPIPEISFPTDFRSPMFGLVAPLKTVMCADNSSQGLRKLGFTVTFQMFQANYESSRKKFHTSVQEMYGKKWSTCPAASGQRRSSSQITAGITDTGKTVTTKKTNP